ncbi:MAG: DUF2242 domain-containing protein [Burkholderiaceae bacterium]|jgi:hypothetical protein|nr:DUF2242 domain-containing protein [Burkholderiaceae bacterium]
MSLHVCLRRGLIASVAVALSACTGLTSPQPAPLVDYQPESFSAASVFAHHFAARPARTCEAARRALLSQGYAATSASPGQVTGRKYFQPDAEHHVQMEFKVVCTPQAGDGAASMAFASGLKEQYVMRKAKNSATLGVGGIGSLSLPVEGSLDALVMVSSETVVDGALYARLFALVDEHLNQAVEPPPAPEAPASAAPAAPPATQAPVFVLVPQQLLPAAAAAALALQPPESAASAPEPAASAPESAASAAGGP